MADTSLIEWTDATWNPITGCTLESEGCRYCYAARLAAGRMRNHPSRQGLARRNADGVAKFTGEVRFNRQWLTQPLSWTRPRMIFVVAHGDLFHPDVPDDWIDQIFAVMALCPQHTFQVLTKRPARMRKWFAERWQPALAQSFVFAGETIELPAETVGEGRRVQIERACEDLLRELKLDDPDRENLWTDEGQLKAMQWKWPLPNVWLGTSVENQATADLRIPELLATPAALRFVSAEPLLGPIDFDGMCDGFKFYNPLTGSRWLDPPEDQPGASDREGGRIDWVIAGGESGSPRPSHPDWFRSLRDQCAAAGVPFLFKQWGDWHSAKGYPGHMQIGHVFNDGYQMVRVGKTLAGRLLDGVAHDGMPAAAGARSNQSSPSPQHKEAAHV